MNVPLACTVLETTTITSTSSQTTDIFTEVSDKSQGIQESELGKLWKMASPMHIYVFA